MPKLFLLLALCGVGPSACVPGPALDRPPVEGIVTDATTHRPVGGARVTLIKLERPPPRARIPWHQPAVDASTQPTVVEEDTVTKPRPSALSDAQGHFTLPARYKLGVVLLYGDPLAAPVLVRISREGYRDQDIRESYNFYLRPFEVIRVNAALEPNSTPARAKSGQMAYIPP